MDFVENNSVEEFTMEDSLRRRDRCQVDLTQRRIEDASVAIVRVFCLHFTLSLCNDKTNEPRADKSIHRYLQLLVSHFHARLRTPSRSEVVSYQRAVALAKFASRLLRRSLADFSESFHRFSFSLNISGKRYPLSLFLCLFVTLFYIVPPIYEEKFPIDSED